VCAECGAAQSPDDPQWRAEIAEIYSDYSIFPQSGGLDQPVIDGATGALRMRCEILCERVGAARGLAVDVGCGSGVMLRALSARGGWRLHGLDLNQRYLPTLEKIAGFETLHTCPPADLPGVFDLIAMVHSLEHFPAPLEALRDLRSKVASGGRLLVEVPDAGANPFACLIADHATHFTLDSLGRLASNAGWEIEEISDSWIAKELSLTAQTTRDGTTSRDREGAVGDLKHRSLTVAARFDTVARFDIRGQIAWLGRLVEGAEQASRAAAHFGLFGSSIAATWLTGILGDRVKFFVEEDANRIGRTHLGRPILRPSEVPSGSVVYTPLAPQIAARIAARLAGTVDLKLPPPLQP
jgi:SAM-dependent methyltransferase